MGQADNSSEAEVRVFTQLCKKANISLFGNAMTIYPKLKGVTIGDARCSGTSKKLSLL